MRTRWLRARTALDRLAAACLLLLIAPVIFVAAAAVRRHDGGAAFVRLQRIGRNGQCFDMWKLRTMRPGRRGDRAGGSILSAADDERVTSVGQTLRRFRLDEGPQLFNVLKGDMSLLGPRPEDPDFVSPSDTRWRTILRQPPGIAGLTQVLVHDWEAIVLPNSEREAAYRNRVLPTKLIIDQWYVTNATPLIDLLVVLALMQRFLRGRRHTILHQRVLPALPPQVATNLTSLDQAEADSAQGSQA